MIRTAAIAILVWSMSPLYAWADASSSSPLVPASLWWAWNFDPLILLNLSLLGAGYLLGIKRLWRKTGSHTIVSRGQATAYLSSLGILFFALLSPLHALSEELASAHMVQHMLLMVVAAPLFVLGSPGTVLIWGFEKNWRPAVANWRRWVDVELLQRPLVAWVIYAAALWLWHLPAAYQAALVDPLVHDAQHLSFFAAACLFWRVTLNPSARHHLHPLTAVGFLFTTSLHAMLLGVFMALSPAVWYEIYAARTQMWGLTPHEDQQLAGLIMWMPACLIYPAAAAASLGRWLSRLAASSTNNNCQRTQASR